MSRRISYSKYDKAFSNKKFGLVKCIYYFVILPIYFFFVATLWLAKNLFILSSKIIKFVIISIKKSIENYKAKKS